MAVRPIPADTPPGKVVDMVREKEAGLAGLRAFVKITVQEHGGQPKGFDAVLYVAKPDKVRLTGLSFMGFTVFDAVLSGEKFYFYQPDTGYLYTGERDEMGGFLSSLGVSANPELIRRALLFEPPAGRYRYFYEKTEDGYSIYYVKEGGDVITPDMRADYDLGLNLVRKVFYDELARPSVYVVHLGGVKEDGFVLPETIEATDIEHGYSITVDFDKYIVNPEDMEDDFTISGGELREIRTVE